MEKIEGYHPNIEEPDLSGTYSAKDYLSWKLGEYIELIKGKIFKMSPAPSSFHQEVSGLLTTILNNHFKRKCNVYAAPFDVYLVKPGEDWKSTNNIFQPDLCVVCDKEKLHERGCIGAPDLVIEILSPSTAAKDVGLKRDIYEDYGVKELWIIHPEEKTVVIHVLENGRYKILPMAVADQIIHSSIFPDLAINLGEIFPEE